MGRLYTFFEHNGYTLISAPYGNKFSGYMGVCIAYPIMSFELLDVIIAKPADSVQWPTEIPYCWFSTSSSISIAKNQKNTLILAKLKTPRYSKEFWVAVYHMPCKFAYPDVMMYHALASLQIVQKYAEDLPYIFAGDFNSLPESDVYKTIVNADKKNVYWEKDGVEFRIDTVKSAYMNHVHREPEYTNYSHGFNGFFKGCIDYIFYNDFDVLFVEDIVADNVLLPSIKEPSDHLPVYAEFEFQ
jgi:mRNA deadenylase 3'-5' endonuclease subunit Ccr4